VICCRKFQTISFQDSSCIGGKSHRRICIPWQRGHRFAEVCRSSCNWVQR